MNDSTKVTYEIDMEGKLAYSISKNLKDLSECKTRDDIETYLLKRFSESDLSDKAKKDLLMRMHRYTEVNQMMYFIVDYMLTKSGLSMMAGKR